MRSRQRVARASDKGTRDFLKLAAAKGWTATGGGQRHYRITCPNSCHCAWTISASGSDINATRALQARLRHYTCWENPKP